MLSNISMSYSVVSFYLKLIRKCNKIEIWALWNPCGSCLSTKYLLKFEGVKAPPTDSVFSSNRTFVNYLDCVQRNVAND